MKYAIEEWGYEFINDLAFHGNGEVVSSYDMEFSLPTTQEEAVDFIEENILRYSSDFFERNFAIVVNGEAVGNIVRHFDSDGRVLKEFYWISKEYASLIAF